MDKRQIFNSNRWARNREHWEKTLDSENLGRHPARNELADQVALYETADVRFALDRLEPLRGTLAMDIGGGLALGAVLLARRGARVIITDIAASRLKLARENLRALGLDDRVFLVAGTAENLPFRTDAVDRLFTKSVLIHTRLNESTAECSRVLKPTGRAAFIEPLRNNPFVNAYRRLAAPKVWREITTYFSPGEIATVRRAMQRDESRITTIRPYFFTAFFASVFAFALKSPRLYNFAEAILLALDKILFRLAPRLKKKAWFAVMVVRNVPDS